MPVVTKYPMCPEPGSADQAADLRVCPSGAAAMTRPTGPDGSRPGGTDTPDIQGSPARVCARSGIGKRSGVDRTDAGQQPDPHCGHQCLGPVGGAQLLVDAGDVGLGGRLAEVELLADGSAAESTRLSDREHEVLLLLADGLGAAAIGDKLYLSESTAKSHIARIYQKLGATNRAQALVTAMRIGLLSSVRPVDN